MAHLWIRRSISAYDGPSPVAALHLWLRRSISAYDESLDLGDRPVAVFTDPDSARLTAAVLPGTGREPRYRLGKEPDPTAIVMLGLRKGNLPAPLSCRCDNSSRKSIYPARLAGRRNGLRSSQAQGRFVMKLFLEIVGKLAGFLPTAMMIAAFVAVFHLSLRANRNRWVQGDVARDGVELEAEILARFEAGALQGSELAKARQPLMASWDPLELELRYVFDGREIISRGQVSVETFFRTRSMTTLKIKVSPDQPEKWTALA
jgi:hypothetical protein